VARRAVRGVRREAGISRLNRRHDFA